jgi:flagellar motor switch protein FliG
MPKLLLGYSREELVFWSKILSQSTNQEGILLDLEHSRPDLYPLLAKYRFKLEDIPSLPTPLILKVLNEVENDELALGLFTCPKDIADFVINELSPMRRELLSNQFVTLHGISNDKTQQARKALTQRFREVMV